MSGVVCTVGRGAVLAALVCAFNGVAAAVPAPPPPSAWLEILDAEVAAAIDAQLAQAAQEAGGTGDTTAPRTARQRTSLERLIRRYSISQTLYLKRATRHTLGIRVR